MRFLFYMFFIFISFCIFFLSKNFLLNWSNIYDSFVNYIFFKKIQNVVDKDIEKDTLKDLKNIVFIWIDDKFFKKTYKNNIDNIDYYVFLKKLQEYQPESLIIDNLRLSLASKNYQFILSWHLNNLNDLFKSYNLLKSVLISTEFPLFIGYDNSTISTYLSFKNYKNIYLAYSQVHKNDLNFFNWFIINKNYQILPVWYMLFLYEKNIGKYKLLINDNSCIIKDINNNLIVRKIPLINNSIIKTPFLVSYKNISYYSIYDILQDKNNNLKHKLKWKTIFLGFNTDKYNINSYMWKLPLSFYHINSYLSIKHNFYYKNIDKKFVIYYIAILLWLSVLLTLIYKDIKVSFVFTFFSIFFSIFLYYVFLSKSWLFIPLWKLLIIFFVKLFLDFIFWIIYWYIKRRQIVNLFDKYVWDRVLEEKQKKSIIVNEKKAFILFTDIENFTNISEKLSPKKIFEMLNIYFYYLWKEIEKSWWFIDKYIWDSIMAFWDSKKHVDEIFDVLLNMKQLHLKINDEIHKKVDKNINLKTRMWIHYWDVLIWDIWNYYWKISYTSIWDNVNVASRLEWVNKFYNTDIIFSEQVLNTIKHTSKYTYRLIDKIAVKGKSKWIKIYELISDKNLYDTKYIRKFEQGVYYYISWNFDRAYMIFTDLLLWYEKIAQNDKVLKILIKRIEFLRKNSPKIWDWIWRYDTK